MSAPLVLLDTNVWNYIVAADAVEVVRKAALSAGVEVAACPAVVYECLRVSDPKRRRSLAKALSRPCWHRLMPEAFEESEELRREIARLRPEWLRQNPDLRRWSQNKADWRGGFWRRVRTQPHRMREIIGDLGDSRLSLARVQSAEARRDARDLKKTDTDLLGAQVSFTSSVPGWNGKAFERWRALGVQHWWDDVVLSGSPAYVDWVGPWFNTALVRSDLESWVTFWTREVEARNVPRLWIRSAMSELQELRKVTDGTPGDTQIATYLCECDMFVTSDRGFAWCIERMTAVSPVPLAELSLSPGGADAVGHVVRVLSKIIS